jgi:LuxR family transcriptional regulator, activator of conjugal transfer of Ti plasmids
MHRVFQAFIDGLAAGGDAERLRSVLADAGAALDLSCFAYLSRRGDAPELISNYPVEWTDHYLREHYERVDPVIVDALKTIEPFEWGCEFEAKSLSKPQCALLDEAAVFGIRCGFTVPVHDSRGLVAAVTFAADEQRPLSSAALSKIDTCCSSWLCIFMLTHADGYQSIASLMGSRCRRANSSASNGPHKANLRGRLDAC